MAQCPECGKNVSFGYQFIKARYEHPDLFRLNLLRWISPIFVCDKCGTYVRIKSIRTFIYLLSFFIPITIAAFFYLFPSLVSCFQI